MYWYLEAIKKYVQFSGRSRRKEYWLFTLLNLLISLSVASLEIQVGMSDNIGGGLLSNLYALAVFIPGLAVSVRRLHDTNRSGWWLLISLVPCVGPILLIVYLAEDSQPGENKYGLNPKETSMWPSYNSPEPPLR